MDINEENKQIKEHTKSLNLLQGVEAHLEEQKEWNSQKNKWYTAMRLAGFKDNEFKITVKKKEK